MRRAHTSLVRTISARRFVSSVLVASALVGAPGVTAQEPTVNGTFVVNGETVELPFAYVWPKAKGFYAESDPTWTLLFVERAVPQGELDGIVSDAAWIEIGITRTAEFGDEPELQVYSQSIKLSAGAAGNISGGNYPDIELGSSGPDRFAGRVHHVGPQQILDDTFQFDFTFDLPFSDPDAPIGDPLPAGGGEPGRAYLRWVEAIHSGDVAGLRALVPAELAEQLEGEDGKEQLELMKELTPTDVTILSGSTDGETAVLKIEGVQAGERLPGEITLTRMGEHWVPIKESW